MVLSALDGFYMQFLFCRSASQKLHEETVEKSGKKMVFSLQKGSLFYRSCRRFLHAIFVLPNGKTKIACRNRPRQIEPFYSKVAKYLESMAGAVGSNPVKKKSLKIIDPVNISIRYLTR